MIRVRLAPSPTGKLHLGTARTALFNYLFAKRNQGRFILRFEDTDLTRSSKDYEEDIKAGLRWLGIVWDEEYHQTERIEKYQEYAQRLVDLGFAEVKQGAIIFKAKEALEKLKLPYTIQKRTFEKQNESSQKNPFAYLVEKIGTDIIHGPIKGLVSDAVLLRSGHPPLPTFHLAGVVDDYEMKISHVIRGDDHLPNTPLHLLLQKCFGFPSPLYAHIPLILSPDRTKLSKRHKAVAVSDYQKMGYLPEAIVNYLALLGWTPKNTEILSLKKMIQLFDLKDIQRSPAVFYPEKLDWLNKAWMRRLTPEELTKRIIDFGYKNVDQRMVCLIQPRVRRLDEIPFWTDFFFKKINYQRNLLTKEVSSKEALEILRGLKNSLSRTPWKNDKIKAEMQKQARSRGLEMRKFLAPVRVAITASLVSPPLFESMEILGKQESLERINDAIKKLSQRGECEKN